MADSRTSTVISKKFCGFLLGILLPLQIASGSTPPGCKLLRCDRSGATIELQLPQFQTASVEQEGQVYTDITLPGWGKIFQEGRPALPQGGLLLALPPGAQPRMTVEILQTRVLPLNNPLPAPTLQVDIATGQFQEICRPDAETYASSSPFPQNLVELGPPVWMRTFWVVPIRITPFQAYCARAEMLVADKLIIHVSFSSSRPGYVVPDPYGQGLAQSALLNYTQALSWQEKSSLPPSQQPQSYGQYKVLVDHDGLYSITYDDLLAAGIAPEEIDPQTLKLYLQGSQIPLWVEGEWDGQFDAGDYILFFGTFARGTYTYENLYTRTNVYWLDWGGSSGLRLPERSVAPGSAVLAEAYQARTHVEVDTVYEKFGFAPLTDNVDHWMWYRLDENFSPQLSYLINLPGYVTQTGLDCDLIVSLRGFTFDDSVSPDHRVTVDFNGYSAIDATWDSQNQLITTGTVPNNIAGTTTNEILFSAPQVPEVMANAFYLDWIEIDYWRNFAALNDTLLFRNPQNMGPGQIRFQLTGLQNPQVELWNLTSMERLVDFQRSQDTLTFQDLVSDSTFYFVGGQNAWLQPQAIVPDQPTNWKDPSHGADYLMITHEDFYDALAPLVSLYQSRGLRVERVKVGDIYDEFSYGMKDPQSIYDFIQYAFFNYQAPAPAYVLLVGDASWDYKNYDNLPYLDYLPTHSFMSYKWGETASDNWFAAVSGTDPQPDCFLGRFPVNTAAETNILVQKSLSYAQAPPGNWRSQVIFSNGAYSATEDAPFFDSTAQALIETYFPPWYDPPRIYSTPSVGNEMYQGTEQDLINVLNLGAASVNYIGHAGNQMWETLNQSSISSLINGEKYFFVQGYSCFTGIFSNTTGFGETFILHPDGGAISFYSNGGIGYMGSNAIMNNYLFARLFAVPDSLLPTTIGLATTGAKWDYYATWADAGNVVRTFTLLGDPGSDFIYEDPNPADTLDNAPPEITITAGAPNFNAGDYLSNPIQFSCEIYDSTMIDVSTLILQFTHLTNSQGNSVDTTWTWVFAPDSLPPPGFTFTFSAPTPQGQDFLVSYQDSLAAGEWQFTISVSDFFLQGPTTASLDFRISSTLQFQGQPLNYPNPFHDQTSFTFSLTQPAQVTVKIYTVSGKLIRTLVYSGQAGYNICEWNGLDQEGDPLSNGAYLYKIIARSGSQQVERTEKMAKVR